MKLNFQPDFNLTKLCVPTKGTSFSEISTIRFLFADRMALLQTIMIEITIVFLLAEPIVGKYLHIFHIITLFYVQQLAK